MQRIREVHNVSRWSDLPRSLAGSLVHDGASDVSSNFLPLLIQPSADLHWIGDPFDDGYLPITGNQHRSGNLTLPAGINLEAQTRREKIVKNPILGSRETCLRKHRGCILHLVRDQVGIDNNKIEIRSLA